MLAPGVNIEIGGRVRVMRPTIRCMMAIERELNTTSMGLIARVMRGDIGVTDIMCIMYNGLQGTTDRMERSEIEPEFENKGITFFIPVITEFLKGHMEGQPAGKPQDPPSPEKTPGEPSTALQSAS